MPEPDHTPTLRPALRASDELANRAASLRLTEETLAQMRSALHNREDAEDAIAVLAWLDTDFTVALLHDLVWRALGLRHTLRVRNLLGRLPYNEAKALVPPAVTKLLEASPDGDSYMRMAELLEHLGLHEALRALLQVAGDSIDEDVREVTEYFTVDH